MTQHEQQQQDKTDNEKEGRVGSIVVTISCIYIYVCVLCRSVELITQLWI